MNTLDVNTNGAWRTVVKDLLSSAQADVKAACVAITNASAQARGGRRAGVRWRLRDAEDQVFARLEYSADEAGTPTTEWRYRL